MARYGLNLSQKNNKSDRKKKVAFICIFLCFVIVLGSVSTLLLWRSLNYDFNNIFVKADESTSGTSAVSEASEQAYAGQYVFCCAVTSDDGKQTYFVNLISVDLAEKTIRVVPVDKELVDPKTNLTCGELLSANGSKALVDFLNGYYSVGISRYAVFTETGYKSFFRYMGDITIEIPEDVAYDTDDMFLELSVGENVLTPDKTYKYMKYLCETKPGYESAELNANIIVASFNSYFNAERFATADTSFSSVVNYCSTDITIVDFTNAKDEIEYLIPKSSKETLKVFVSDKVKVEESSDAQ